MKKLLLLGALAGMMLNASADVTVQAPKHISRAPQGNMQSMKIDAATIAKMKHAAPRAAEGEATPSMNFTLADEPYYAITLDDVKTGDKLSMAFEIDPETATQLAGNTITGISFYQGIRKSQFQQNNYIKDATVFLTYDLQEEPFVTAKAVTTTKPFSEIFVDLPETFKIEAGKRVFVGVTSKILSTKDLAIVVDYMDHNNDNGGWAALNGTWTNIYDEWGFCCVGAIIEGNNLPTNNMSVQAISAPEVVTLNTPFYTVCEMRNNGADEIESFEMSLKIGNQEPMVRTLTPAEIGLTQPFTYGKTIALNLNVAYDQAGPNQVPISMEITKVNGEANRATYKGASTSTLVLDPDKAYHRAVVIEEFTGTWCGFCPRGIVGMEYLAANYTSKDVIAIAAHADDPMQADSYLPVIRAYAPGFPSAAVNRKEVIDPSAEDFAAAIDEYGSAPTIGSITGSAMFNADCSKVTFNTETAFCFDFTGNKFTIEYVLIEDNVGPYAQENYYAGGQMGELPGWDNKGGQVSTIYNEVARTLDTYGGVAGSVPASITAGTSYSFTHEVAVPSSVKDAKNLHAIALLVNKTDGSIVNGMQCEIAEDPAGVSDVSLDSENAPVEYFNLQGIRVENPQGGIFIRRQGKTVSKVAL